MKVLTIIQIVLTVVALIAFAVWWEMVTGIHHFASADPARKVAEERAREFGHVFQYAIFMPWLLFTVGHVAARVGRRFQSQPEQSV